MDAHRRAVLGGDARRGHAGRGPAPARRDTAPRRAGAHRRRRHRRHAAHPGHDVAGTGPTARRARSRPPRGRAPGGDRAAGRDALGARRPRLHGRARRRDPRDAEVTLGGPAQPDVGAARATQRRCRRDAERRLPPGPHADAAGRARRGAAAARRGSSRPGRAPHVLASLDLEETMLDRLDDQESRLAESEMLPVDTIEAAVRAPAGGGLVPAAADARGVRGVPARRHDAGCTCASASCAGTSAAATRRRASTRQPTSTRRSTR